MKDPDAFSSWISRARRQVEQAARAGTPPDGDAMSASADAPALLPHYELLRELARGGQGVVYLARQQGTKRLVAVKMVREGPFSSTSERIRFEREIEILGSLNHPHIVTIHDSGVAAGCSYFVMDYIEGPTLDDHIAPRRRVGLAGAAHSADFVHETLGLFAHVCDAVHAAHLRGVIHRDLKPSNIRLNEHGQPLVLDFGLAKSTTREAAPGSLPTLTETGQFVGTVNYASPEQVENADAPVDLRTDIYALGVILYELLTGCWPYDTPETDSVRRKFDAIVAREPRRPRDAMPRLAEEVETILLKCLSKQPQRRYQSAGELAQDIRRHLAGEPIDAKRDSALYVLRKNLHRHRVAVAIGSLFLAVLLVATITLAIMYDREHRARERALRHHSQVNSLAQKFIFDLDNLIRPLSGSATARSRMVAIGLQYLDELAREPGDDPQTLADLAGAYMKTGDIQGGLNADNLGDTAGARASYDKALHIAQALHEANPTEPNAIARLAQAHVCIGDSLTQTGQFDEVLPSYRRALALAEQLPAAAVQHHRLHSICHTKIGNVLARQGKLDDALGHYGLGLDMARDLVQTNTADYLSRTDVAVYEFKIGRVLEVQGEVDAALQHYLAALDARRALLEDHPDSAEQRHAWAQLLVDVGGVLFRRKQTEEALAYYEQALATNQTLSDADPQNSKIALELALLRERIAGVLVQEQRLEAALENYEASLGLRQAVVDRDPDNAKARRELSVAHEKMGNMLVEFDRIEDALHHYEGALRIRRALAAGASASAEAQRDLAVSHFKIGATHATASRIEGMFEDARQRHWRDAHGAYTRSLEIVEAMQRADMLASNDAGLPDMLNQRIAECELQLAAQSTSTPD